MAKDMSKCKVPVGRFEVALAPILRFEEMKAIAKGVRGDDVARVCLEYGMHLQDRAILSALIPSCEHLFQVFSDDRFNPTNTGVGKEGIDAVAAHAVSFVVQRSNDGVRCWRGSLLA